jgi:hypothetical protein
VERAFVRETFFLAPLFTLCLSVFTIQSCKEIPSSIEACLSCRWRSSGSCTGNVFGMSGNLVSSHHYVYPIPVRCYRIVLRGAKAALIGHRGACTCLRVVSVQPRQTRARERQSRVGMGQRRALFATALARPLSRTVSLFARVALTPAAHASHVLVLVCHRNALFQADLRGSSRSRDAIASTRDVCATRQPNTPGPRLLP